MKPYGYVAPVIDFSNHMQAQIKMFGGSAPTPPQPVPVVPSQSAADLAAQTKAAQDAEAAQQNAGRASTIITGQQGAQTQSAAKQLLGD